MPGNVEAPTMDIPQLVEMVMNLTDLVTVMDRRVTRLEDLLKLELATRRMMEEGDRMLRNRGSLS